MHQAIPAHTDKDLEEQIQEIGTKLLKQAQQRHQSPSLLLKLFENMNSDDTMRLQVLRFIDTLPSLDDDGELMRHIDEYFQDKPLPLADWGRGLLGNHLGASAIRRFAKHMAGHFLAGENSEQLLKTMQALRKRGINTSLDLLGEAVLSETEADTYQQACLQLFEQLAPAAENLPSNDGLDRLHGTINPRLNLSIKLSSLFSRTGAHKPEHSIREILSRLRPILRQAQAHDAAVTIDMEQYELKSIILQCFKRVLIEEEFRHWPHCGIAIQAYLRDTDNDLQDLIAWARERGTPVHIRLVRGAYWDMETAIAHQQGWPTPVYTEKAATDAAYERHLQTLLSAYPDVHCAAAGHNPRSIAVAMAIAQNLGLDRQQLEFQMLYGMGGGLTDAIIEQGWSLRTYCPFGELLPGMAYLVRRLLENSESQSIDRLHGQWQEHSSDLLAAPQPHASSTNTLKEGFENQAVFRFTEADEHRQMQQAIESVRQESGQTPPLMIAGKAYESDDQLDSCNPAAPQEVLGRLACADAQLGTLALQSARKALPDWQTYGFQGRAELLRKAARQLCAERYQFAALEILEAGKSWKEADADVCEAIDFLNWYADQAELIGAEQHVQFPGEANHHTYQGKGIGLIIPPWNFPLAITVGMLSAAIVCGNSTILKPSSQTPLVAARFTRLLSECGLPDGVVSCLPGSGARLGNWLSRQADPAFIAFTGSREVGLNLIQQANAHALSHGHIKNVIAEMGGKNAIIVDADADLDEAIGGILHSAFGFQGQKCSACSRVIVVGDHYDALLQRLSEAVDSLYALPPEDPACDLGPVIDAASQQRIERCIEQGQRQAKLYYRGEQHKELGHYVPPAIFSETPADSPLAQEEIFGPALCLIRAKDFGHALEIANNTRYALTGGVYSRSPSHLQRARMEFQVGNLYLNRGITGALVGRQPFGGYRLSGTGMKAGGKDYLLQYLQARCITENTLRKGYAPKFNQAL